MSISDRSEGQLTLWSEDHPASQPVSPASASVRRMTAGSGLSSYEPFARLDHDGSWLRIRQGSCQWTLDGRLEGYSESFPRSGTMSNGTCSAQPRLVPPISENESGLLPTPATVDSGAYFNRGDSPNAANRPTLGAMAKHNLWPTPTAGDDRGSSPGILDAVARHRAKGQHKQVGLRDAVKLWPTPAVVDGMGGRIDKTLGGKRPSGAKRTVSLATAVYNTPTANDAKNNGSPSQVNRDSLNSQIGGQLNPTWVEWLMGFPLGWTDLKA